MKSKAIFLLVIFLLNTVVAFSCVLGMEGNDRDADYSHSKFALHMVANQCHLDTHEHKLTSVVGQSFKR